MQLFFEEESSKKLIRHQQIIVILIMGYIELMEYKMLKSHQTMTSVKNILANIHRNYLVFVEFICKNLTYQQKTKTKEWVEELYRILEERPVAKTYYRCNNTQTLIRNNELSQNLLKNLCRTASDQNEYLKMTLEIIKNIDNISVWWVHIKAREIVDYVKENRNSRSISSIKSSGLSRRKSYGLKSSLGFKRSDSNMSSDNPYSSKKTVNKLKKQVSEDPFRKDVKSLTIDLYTDKNKQAEAIKNKKTRQIKEPAPFDRSIKKSSNLKDYQKYPVGTRKPSGLTQSAQRTSKIPRISKMQKDVQSYMRKTHEREVR